MRDMQQIDTLEIDTDRSHDMRDVLMSRHAADWDRSVSWHETDLRYMRDMQQIDTLEIDTDRSHDMRDVQQIDQCIGSWDMQQIECIGRWDSVLVGETVYW